MREELEGGEMRAARAGSLSREKRVHRPGDRSQPEERKGRPGRLEPGRHGGGEGERPSSRPDEELGLCSEVSVVLSMISALKRSLELC